MLRKSETETKIDNEINVLLSSLDVNATAAEYDATLNHIDRLQKMKAAETRTSPRVSPDTVVMAVTNLMGIALVIRHEHMNVITSKALGFVQKTK